MNNTDYVFFNSNKKLLHVYICCARPNGRTVRHIKYYYTSEEFFLYKITVDKQTIHHFSRQNELLTGPRGYKTFSSMNSYSKSYSVLQIILVLKKSRL